MENIKLIAMDMDGTLLLDNGMGIAPACAEALRQAHEAGIELALCSGRIPDDMSFYALDVGVPMHILALNGTCTLAKPLGEIVRNDCIPDDAARAIYAMLQGAPVHYGIFSGHDLMTSAPLTQAQLALIFGANVLREGSRTTIYSDKKCAEMLLDRGVNKYMIFSLDDPAALAAFRVKLEAAHLPVDVSSSWINNLEVNPAGANKGRALTALADDLRIPLGSVMAIGDNDNDIPMLDAAGIPVAMGNASVNAAAHARYITLSNAEDGVAAAISAIALGKDVPGVRRCP